MPIYIGKQPLSLFKMRLPWHNNNAMESDDVLYRDGDFSPRDRKTAADYYEHMLSGVSWRIFNSSLQSITYAP